MTTEYSNHNNHSQQRGAFDSVLKPLRGLAVALTISASAILPLAAGATPLSFTSLDAANCQYVLGFKTLHDAMPEAIGECETNETHNPENGDAIQKTTKGLLVWRKATNTMAFTDGHQTLVAGPAGIQTRLNGERFEWEKNETGDDNLARRSGLDDNPTHDATHDLNDDNLPRHSGLDDGPNHDAGDDNGANDANDDHGGRR